MIILKKLLSENCQIAFSGGADSLALAHYLGRYSPTLYHFNHHLLPEDNDIEDRVRMAAKALNLRLEVVEAKESYIKGSTEDFCRRLRYDWFKTIGGTLLTAHNLNDSVESYILNCLKGHPEYLPIPTTSVFGKTKVTRPMILTPKLDVIKYLEKHKIAHLVAEDPLNSDITRMRNWLRLSLLPQIKEKTNLEKVVRKRYLKHFEKK
jgi:tRNA(Ile)-lysidine synthetase-like protein